MEKKEIKLKTRILVSIALGVLAFITGFCISWGVPSGNTPEEIKEIERAMGKLYKDVDKEPQDIFDRISFWESIKKVTSSLVYENEKIAKAKALAHCKESPMPKYSIDEHLWNDRYEIGDREWKIQTFGSRILVGAGIAVLSYVGTAVGVFLILTIMPWLWYCLLERISELSQAIRGE